MRPALPDFRDPVLLREHVLQTMAFYDGRCIDPAGGFYHFYKDDGSVYDASTRHLVSSARFVVTHAMAARHFPQHPRAAAWRDAAAHGLRFLREVHRQPQGGYAWLLRFDHGRAEVLDTTNHCYGLAFVLLAHAHAAMAGVDGAREGIGETFELMERRFWEADHGLYADEADARWTLSPYRGQNANMHACEAMLAAHEATGEARYLKRAFVIAESITGRLARAQHGLVWEHWRIADDGHDWVPDWDYNRDDRSNIFRPWGYQVGHLAEWAKLLMLLERHDPEPGEGGPRVERARELFNAAVTHWDRKHGGLVYGFAPDGKVCDGDKYHWVQAETIAAAAVLAERTAAGAYWDWYDLLWQYVWQHFVDHQHGAWFRILGPANEKLTDEKSPAGKVDYHNMGACYEAIAALER